MKLSYCITACNEFDELFQLINYLLPLIREEDEIVVLQDMGEDPVEGNMPDDRKPIYDLCSELHEEGKLKYYPGLLNNHFANFKNELFSLATGDWIFQIDADEYPNQPLIEKLPEILQSSDKDVLLVPRINVVNGITQEHVKKWAWGVNEHGWINFPDWQMRLYRNDYPRVKWINKVHERIEVEGKMEVGMLAQDPEHSLIHIKDINKQEKQNAYYDTL